MLSQKTIDEMRAGAEQLALHASANGISPEYMEGMIRTQQRAKWLKQLHNDGKIQIERVIRPRTNDKHSGDTHTVVRVGKNEFTDPAGELVGSWPSECLVAEVALALAAGQGTK